MRYGALSPTGGSRRTLLSKVIMFARLHIPAPNAVLCWKISTRLCNTQLKCISRRRERYLQVAPMHQKSSITVCTLAFSLSARASVLLWLGWRCCHINHYRAVSLAVHTLYPLSTYSAVWLVLHCPPCPVVPVRFS